MAQCLMVQGTTSDAGKTTLVAGLARVLARRGLKVAPFKPQNMALNSAVTEDGGEIGRAQALQALACGVLPHTDMNPILLKPPSDVGAQVIVCGKSIGNMNARTFHEFKPQVLALVVESYRRLSERYDYVLGAGSPAEINLRQGDIANMGFAEAIDCPVILVADIDKGGVFAHLVGTLACLSCSERQRIRGFVINKFRGDESLLQPGLEWLESETGKPVLGVLPYWHGLYLDGEDAIDVGQERDLTLPSVKVVVPVFSRISNHTDFDVLRQHPQVDLCFVGPGEAVPPADLIVLPGSKNVRSDMHWLRHSGWQPAIKRHLRYGGRLIGICGGFQMLGSSINDPHGVEGSAGESPGLDLLAMETRLERYKHLHRTTGNLSCLPDGPVVEGYEIHCGVTTGDALKSPAITFDNGTSDGAISADGQILGTYLHGLFDHPQALAALLRWAGLSKPEFVDHGARRNDDLNRIADDIERHIDLQRLFPELAVNRALQGQPLG